MFDFMSLLYEIVLGAQFDGNAFMNATEPWSGHYKVFPVIWINAHWNQFVKPGWKFLSTGKCGEVIHTATLRVP